MISYYILFFVHVFLYIKCLISPKAIHNNTGNFCHKSSEPLNVHQSNLALLVSIFCMFYYFLLSVAVCFVHEWVLRFFLGQHREVSSVVYIWCIDMVQNDPFNWKNEWCEANNLVLYSFFLTDYRPAGRDTRTQIGWVAVNKGLSLWHFIL